LRTRGHGTSRIVDDLDLQVPRLHPKWIIGFSTASYSHLCANYKASLHAPMAAV